MRWVHRRVEIVIFVFVKNETRTYYIVVKKNIVNVFLSFNLIVHIFKTVSYNVHVKRSRLPGFKRISHLPESQIKKSPFDLILQILAEPLIDEIINSLHLKTRAQKVPNPFKIKV